MSDREVIEIHSDDEGGLLNQGIDDPYEGDDGDLVITSVNRRRRRSDGDDPERIVRPRLDETIIDIDDHHDHSNHHDNNPDIHPHHHDDDDIQIIDENIGTNSNPLIVENISPSNSQANGDNNGDIPRGRVIHLISPHDHAHSHTHANSPASNSSNNGGNNANGNNRIRQFFQLGDANFRRNVMHNYQHRSSNPISRFFQNFNLVQRQGASARERRGRRNNQGFLSGLGINVNSQGNIRFLTNLNDDISSSSDDPDYDENTGYFPDAPIFEVFGFNNFFQGDDNDDLTTSAHIMERIERDNEQMMDRKLHDENVHNRSIVKQKREIIKNEVKGYNSNISHDENIGCELCGITLGEGIPADFKPDIKYSKNLESYSKDNNVLVPWFCFKQLTDVDKDLSKRVFVAKCGHLYCGRCMKNIGNRPRMKRGQKNTLIKDIENPNLFAPKQCIAVGCDAKFRGKKVWTELYF